ncbi:MAG TPA: HD domain-containing protein [Acidimicrobiales bacterium]|nr:HD domain-containing protein [Acidimicrobiales bacterium]
MGISPFSTVDDLTQALRSLEDRHSDDLVPALPHLLQTAETLAVDYPDDPTLIAAGLVHDIASALDPACGDHARVGALLVTPLLGERVGDLVAGHTDAKRYLVTVDASYAGTLSPNSTHTLVLQGGPMTDDELSAFERRALWSAMVRLRRADDAAKVPGRPVRAVGAWRPLLEGVASGVH